MPSTHAWPPRYSTTEGEWPWFVGGPRDEETVDWSAVRDRRMEYVVIEDDVPECTCAEGVEGSGLFSCAVHGPDADEDALLRWEAFRRNEPDPLAHRYDPARPIAPEASVRFREDLYLEQKVQYTTAAGADGSRRLVSVKVLAHHTMSVADLGHEMLLRAFGIGREIPEPEPARRPIRSADPDWVPF